jgi:nicotinamide-nucleotide amidase
MKFSDDNITTLAEKVGHLLLQKKLKLVTAESCTGGGIAYAMTSISGSSQWLERGYVTYSNLSKQELLNIPESIIQTYGAVSEETAKAMAEGALKNSHADISLSITGIAGPDGGSKEKPVGTVWFGLARKSSPIKTLHKLYIGNREEIRLSSIKEALLFLLS